MFLELLLLIVLLVLFFNRKPKGLPPGPWGLPVVGNMLTIGKLTPANMKKLVEKYGDFFCLRMGSQVIVFISDYDKIKIAFNKPEIQERPGMFGLETLVYHKNIGLVASNGEVWNKERRFALRHLRDLGLGKTMIQTSIQREASALVSHFNSVAGKPTDLTFEINVAVLNVIWQLVSSQRYGIYDEKMLKLTKLVNGGVELFQGPIALYDLFPALPKFLPTFIQNKIFKLDQLEFYRESLRAYITDVIEEHEKVLDPDNPRDFIDYYLLEMKNETEGTKESREDFHLRLFATIGDLFSAGSETTASSIRWAFLLLAKYPEVQRKLHQNIDDAVPRDHQPTLEDQESLTYMNAVIMEVMRFSSLAPKGFPHSPSFDMILFGYKIPKDATILACNEFLHRNSKYFERPNDFYPEHFIGEDGDFITKKEGFAPFSLGRRQCLGASLVKSELFIFLTTLLQKFEISPAPGEPLDSEPSDASPIINFPKPFKVILSPR